MATASVMPHTVTDGEPAVGVPPSCPDPLPPQHFTVPSFITAQAKSSPSAIATAPVTPDTVIGVTESLVVPSPSAPRTLDPQQATLPVVHAPAVHRYGHAAGAVQLPPALQVWTPSPAHRLAPG